MFLPIYIYGHPVLRKVSQDISLDYPDLKELIDNMFYTMDHADGVGLAGPQIGKNIRLFVVDASAFEEMDPDCKDFRKAFINAHIIERGGEEISREEGCLSIPGIHESVKRPSSIKIKYMDLEGKEHTDIYTGFKAWIIQHEYDHLEGILFTDHMSPLRKRLMRNKMNHIASGKISCSYKTVTAK